MAYQYQDVAQAANDLKQQFKELEDKKAILRSTILKQLYGNIKAKPPIERRAYGFEVNQLKTEVTGWLSALSDQSALPPIDITAPFDVNTPFAKRPRLLSSAQGTIHPLMRELAIIIEIFYKMGFMAVESREIDDDFHMFESLNFPVGHPARDDYDTFMTTDGLIAPAHTSTMQHRVLAQYKQQLLAGEDIRVVIPGRVFRNEDLDARHEHTFYQLEGVYVGQNINAGHLVSTLKTFLQSYYDQSLKIKTQPFYFPFTEPSFELALSCPFCGGQGCTTCGQSGWIELLGCGMIHPSVLKKAKIDPQRYTGFAWGGGIDRLVMMKYDIEDIRHFESGKLEFLRQFK